MKLKEPRFFYLDGCGFDKRPFSFISKKEFTSNEAAAFWMEIEDFNHENLPENIAKLRCELRDSPRKSLSHMATHFISSYVEIANQAISAVEMLRVHFPKETKHFARTQSSWPISVPPNSSDGEEVDRVVRALELGDNISWSFCPARLRRVDGPMKRITIGLMLLAENLLELHYRFRRLRSTRKQRHDPKIAGEHSVMYARNYLRYTLKKTGFHLANLANLLEVPPAFSSLKPILVLLKIFEAADPFPVFSIRTLHIWQEILKSLLDLHTDGEPEKNVVLKRMFNNRKRNLSCYIGLTPSQRAKERKYRVRSEIYGEMKRGLQDILKRPWTKAPRSKG